VLDWDDLRFFLALARHGSLSAAARDLHVAQSTIGRRLASLEVSLGVRLLNRTPDGYVATQAGDGVRARAERLEQEAMALERDVGGRDTRMAGLVRVTCAETVATHILAPCFASLHVQQPDLMIELIPNPRALVHFDDLRGGRMLFLLWFEHPDATQAQRRSPSPHPEDVVQGAELAGV